MFLGEIPNTVSRGGGRERIPPATKTVETTCQRLFRDVLSRNVVRGISERVRDMHWGTIANTHPDVRAKPPWSTWFLGGLRRRWDPARETLSRTLPQT